jgi:hypothetical protein
MNATITQLGSLARACLSPSQRGKVIAVFSKAIYLLTDADELFWIAADDAPMHRRCLRISSPLPGLLAGSPFYVQDHHLRVDSDSIFEIGNPPVWVAPRANRILDIASLSTGIHSFFSQLNASQAKGFGHFIPQILALTNNKSSRSEFADPILQFSQPLVLDLARASLDNQPSRIHEIADRLIGLGAGLTPSGDDFLGSVFFAFHQLQAAYPDFDFADFSILPESYRARTHQISYTLLSDLAYGHTVAPLHHLVNGLLMGEPFEKMYSYVVQLTSIGHSTGWDLLTGLLTGLLITYHGTLENVHYAPRVMCAL